jgi:hypothetical protein
MAYTRFFLPLESEATGYDFNGRTPAGRCIAENRDGAGKITVHAQDLRTQTRYAVYIIFPDSGRYAGIFAGSLNADARGKAELRKDIDLSTLGSFSLDDLIAVAIVATDVTSTVVSPLCGYRERAVSWRGNFYVFEKEEKEVKDKNKDKTLGAPPPIPPQGDIVPLTPNIDFEPAEVTRDELEALNFVNEDVVEEIIPEVEIIPEPEIIPMSMPVPEPEPALEPAPEPEPMPELAPEPVPEPAPETMPEPPRVTPVAPRARKPKGAKPVRKEAVQETVPEEAQEVLESSFSRTENILAIEAIFNSKESFMPFENQAREIKWVQLTGADAVPLPDSRPLLLEEPFIQAAYAVHEHIILGVTADGVQYILGIPAEYSPDHRPQAKRLGFTQFKTNAGDSPKRGDFGYWLLFENL